MATVIRRAIDIEHGTQNPEVLPHALFEGEAHAHIFQLYRLDGEPITGAITGKCLRPDQKDVDFEGQIVDGEAVISLSAGCYQVPGIVTISIYVTSGEVVDCVYQCRARVHPTNGGTHIDGGNVIESLEGLYAEAGVLRGEIDDIVLAQGTQPTEPINKIWFPDAAAAETYVYTKDEVDGMIGPRENLAPSDATIGPDEPAQVGSLYVRGSDGRLCQVTGYDDSEPDPLPVLSPVSIDQMLASFRSTRNNMAERRTNPALPFWSYELVVWRNGLGFLGFRISFSQNQSSNVLDLEGILDTDAFPAITIASSAYDPGTNTGCTISVAPGGDVSLRTGSGGFVSGAQFDFMVPFIVDTTLGWDHIR